MRLDKYISNQTTLSRSEAVKVIRAGKVSVDGTVFRDPKSQVNENSCQVQLNGESVSFKKNIYIMLHKPVGFISSTEDKYLKTVLDLLPDEITCRKPFPCGRLDIDTTGLVLLTDDGVWSHKITSPKKKCFKTYLVNTLKSLSEEDMKKLEEGVYLDGDDKITQPAMIREIDKCRYELKISEGRFHQVKRMMEAVGNKVVKLHRQAIGEIILDTDLKEGDFRELSEDEVNQFL